jgi:cAMP phosphodiesterase
VLPQPLLIYELEAVTEDKFQQLLTKFNNPMELWRKKENAHYLVVTGDIEKDKVLHEYLQNELSAKLAHKLVKTHYFPPVTTQ